jgi:hypothetical protein
VFRGNIERRRVESAEFRADQAVPMSEQLVPPTEQGHALVRSAIIGAFRIWLIKTSASLMAFKASSIQKHDSQHSPSPRPKTARPARLTASHGIGMAFLSPGLDVY